MYFGEIGKGKGGGGNKQIWKMMCWRRSGTRHASPHPTAVGEVTSTCWYKRSAANVWVQWISKSKNARTALVSLGKELHQRALPAPVFHSSQVPSFVSSVLPQRFETSEPGTSTRFAEGKGHEHWKECSERARFVAEQMGRGDLTNHTRS